MRSLDYQSEMGEVNYPDGFWDAIKDLPIEAQSKYFRTTKRSECLVTNWSERTLEYTRALEDDSDVKALIVKDGHIVGAMIEEWFSKKETPVMLDKWVCTYYACDNNGAGYKERTDFTYLICTPTQQEQSAMHHQS